MPLSWIAGSRSQDVNSLMAQRQYDKAVELLRTQVDADRSNVFLRQTLADALVQTGDVSGAARILLQLADDFTESGFVAKAIAILKKIDRIAPGRSDVYERLAATIPRKERDDETLRRQRTATGKQKVPEIEKPAKPASGAIPLAAMQPGEELVFEIEISQPKTITTPLFQSLRPEELLPLMKAFQLKTFEPGDVIVAQGERDSSLFIVTSGRVKAWVRNPVGRFNKVREMTDGEFFGEISFITDEPRTATITAASRCELLTLDKKTAEEICERFPNVRSMLLAFASQRLDSAEELAARGADEQEYKS